MKSDAFLWWSVGYHLVASINLCLVDSEVDTSHAFKLTVCGMRPMQVNGVQALESINLV